MEQNNQQEYILRIEGLHKRFGDTEILKGVNLNIRQGETHVICGPSGSGKSTTLYCINGLEKPTEGKIWFKDELITHKNLRQIRTHIGMVFQHFELFPHLTAMENVLLAPVKIKKMNKEAVRKRAEELFERVGLADRMDFYPYQLSGGQKQRVAIIRVLAMEPDIILFDEPTSALDPEMIKDVLVVMKDLARSGMTMIVVTHELGFAKEVASHISFFEDGNIVETRSPEEFFRGDGSERTQAFLNNIINI